MNQIESNAKRDKRVIILDYNMICFLGFFSLGFCSVNFFLVHQMQYRETTQQQQQIKNKMKKTTEEQKFI